MPAQFLGEIPFGPEGAVRAVHPDFVIFGSANEWFRIHPFLQHQPVAEVHAFDVVGIHVHSFVRHAVSIT